MPLSAPQELCISLKSKFGVKFLAYLASGDNLCFDYISLFKLFLCPMQPRKTPSFIKNPFLSVY